MQTPVGGWHWTHSAVQLAPVVVVFATHAVPDRWNPSLQARTHFVPSHVEVPFAGSVQVAHVAPQASLVVLVTHVGLAAVPRWQKPGVLHTT